MRVTINGTSYDVPDTLVESKVQSLFDKMLKVYDDTDMSKRLLIQMAVKGALLKFAPTIQIPQEKGEDIVHSLYRLIPPLSPEAFKDAELSINTSSENNTFTTTDFNFNIQSTG